jgi:enoyl-CoA hydratase
MPQPVVVSVHGHCYTGGLELALAGDIIIAAEDARFCDTHAKLGIVPRWGLSARLPRRIGLSAAKAFSMTSRPVTGIEAREMGLCNYSVPAARLPAATLELASEIAGQSARSITGIKHLYEKALDLPLEEALRYERGYRS